MLTPVKAQFLCEKKRAIGSRGPRAGISILTKVKIYINLLGRLLTEVQKRAGPTGFCNGILEIAYDHLVKQVK